MSAEAEPLRLQSSHETVGATGRVKNDAYYTPDLLAQKAVSWLLRDGYLWTGMSVLEPSAGRGAWVRAARQIEPSHVVACDIDSDRMPDLSQEACEPVLADFATHEFGRRFDAIIGNPPFVHAEAHVRRALGLRDPVGVVAFLLRLAFLESKDRMPFWREHPASKVYVLSERPSFTGGQTDNSAYAIFAWATWRRSRATELEVCSWKAAA